VLVPGTGLGGVQCSQKACRFSGPEKWVRSMAVCNRRVANAHGGVFEHYSAKPERRLQHDSAIKRSAMRRGHCGVVIIEMI
jgi:hypothetical protein